METDGDRERDSKERNIQIKPEKDTKTEKQREGDTGWEGIRTITSRRMRS